MLAAFDRLEEERLALAANFAISRKGCFEVGQEPARDRHEVALHRQFGELFRGGRIHTLAPAVNVTRRFELRLRYRGFAVAHCAEETRLVIFEARSADLLDL